PERRQHHSDRELHRVLGNARERSAYREADSGDEHERGCSADRGERDRALRAAEGEDDEHDLEPLEQHALEREREPVPVHAGPLHVFGTARLLELAREDRILVMERLVAARAQDRLAQPLQPEDEQERTDDEAQRLDRDHRERRPERHDDDREHDRRRAEPCERGAPPARESRGEDDRERLHELDAAREEGRDNAKDVAATHPRLRGRGYPGAASALAAAVATSPGYVRSPLNSSQELAPSGRIMTANVHCRPERPPPKT